MRSIATQDKFCWILRVIDVNTDFGHSVAQKDKTALTTGQNLAQIWGMQGAPGILQCDNGSEFLGETKRIALAWSPTTVTVINGRPRHPQSQGKCERSHGPFKVQL